MKIAVSSGGLYGLTDPQEITGVLEALGYGHVSPAGSPGEYYVEYMGQPLDGVSQARRVWPRKRRKMHA